MKFLEKDLEEIIYESHLKNHKTLSSKGIYISGKMLRQLRIGNYGIADLVTFDKEYETDYNPIYDDDGYEPISANLSTIPKLIVTVYELKKDKIGISAYLQAIGYVKGLKEYFKERKFNCCVEFNIVLIGNDIDSSGNFCFIPSFNNNVKMIIYSYDLDGIKFNNVNNFKLTNNGFKI